MICKPCRKAADESDPNRHRECTGERVCACQHRGKFSCRCGDYVATSIPDMDDHVVAMMHLDPGEDHGEV